MQYDWDIQVSAPKDLDEKAKLLLAHRDGSTWSMDITDVQFLQIIGAKRDG